MDRIEPAVLVGALNPRKHSVSGSRGEKAWASKAKDMPEALAIAAPGLTRGYLLGRVVRLAGGGGFGALRGEKAPRLVAMADGSIIVNVRYPGCWKSSSKSQ